MRNSSELWNIFERSGEVRDYLNFKDARDGEGVKDPGADYQDQ